MDNPKLSVCHPTFNRIRYLPVAIESVLAQEFRDYELLIVDDASTEHTEEVVRGFRDSRINFVRNPKNLGLVGNWNRCLELARGDYAMIFHDDDVMLPGLLRREVEVLDSNPGVVLVHAASQAIDANGAFLCVMPPNSWPALSSGLEFMTHYWNISGSYVVMPSVMFRRLLALKLGKFDTGLKHSPDGELWQRLAFEGQIAYLDEILISNRIHAAQMTQAILTNSLDMLNERIKWAQVTRALATAHGGNLDREITRRLSWLIAIDLPQLRQWNASVPHVFKYARAAVRVHPQVLYSLRFLAYFGLAILPSPLVRWLKRLHLRQLSSAWSAAREAHENRH